MRRESIQRNTKTSSAFRLRRLDIHRRTASNAPGESCRVRVSHNRGKRVTELVVRNADDERRALAVLAGPQGHLVSNVRYAGWPICRIDAEVPFDLVDCAPRIEDIRERAERQYCLIRHGKDDRRLMTAADKAAVKIGARFENNNRTLLVDLSGAMNANIAAARLRAMEISAGASANLFGEVHGDRDHTEETGKEEYGKWRAGADVGKSIVKRLPWMALMAVLLAGVVVAGLAWTSVNYHEANLNHELALKKEDNAQQLKIAELNQRSITSRDGRPVALTSRAKESLASEDAAGLQHVALMGAMELEHPLIRFVSAQSLDGVASALDAAPETGKVWVNGAEIQAALARGAAKKLRKSAHARRDGGAWITEIIPSKVNGA